MSAMPARGLAPSSELVLAHDLRERPGLVTGRDLFAVPLGRVLVCRRVLVCGFAEEDLLVLQAVADGVTSVDAHVDSGGAEEDEDPSGDESADLPKPLALHRSTSR